jgi:hypothetical protein
VYTTWPTAKVHRIYAETLLCTLLAWEAKLKS